EAIGAGSAIKLAQAERRVGLLMVRGISDMPAETARENTEASGTDTRTSWKPFAADAAAAFTATLIEGLYPAPTLDDRKRRARTTLAGTLSALATLLVLAGVSWYVWRKFHSPFPGLRPAVAVLTFQHLSGNTQH